MRGVTLKERRTQLTPLFSKASKQFLSLTSAFVKYLSVPDCESFEYGCKSSIKEEKRRARTITPREMSMRGNDLFPLALIYVDVSSDQRALRGYMSSVSMW